MRLLTETGIAIGLVVVIAATFVQCVAHGSGSSGPARDAGRPGVAPAAAADVGDPAPPQDPVSAVPKVRCPSGPGRASDQPPGAGTPPSPGDTPIRLLSCR